MWSFCYDKHSPAELLFLCWWTCNLNIVPSPVRCTCSKRQLRFLGVLNQQQLLKVIWAREGAPAADGLGGKERTTPFLALLVQARHTHLAQSSEVLQLQWNISFSLIFSSKASLLLWDFLARCIVLTPRGWPVRHSFILTCKGRNRRSRAAAFFTLPICFQWIVLSPCSRVWPQLRKTFIQHMPKSHWPDWASGLCLRFVLNQGLIDGIFFSAHLNIETQDCNTVYWNVPLPLFHQLMNLVERPSVTGCCNCGKNWTLHLSFHSVR